MPSIIRLHIPSKLAQDGLIATTEGQAHYLIAVMRRSTGDTIRVFNGTDGEFDALIRHVTRRGAQLAVGARTRPASREPDCWLAFAPLKRDATDLIVEKATELGVAALHPVFTRRSQTARVNLDRLTAIATEAAEQSERLTIPAIHEPVDLARFLADFPADRRLFAAVERGSAPPLSTQPPLQPHALLIGPEGGFAPDELDVITRHAVVTQVSLGPRILRAETAAIAGLARLLAAPDHR